MLSDDLLSSYLRQQMQKDESDSPINMSGKTGLCEEFLRYPGLDENEEDEIEMLGQSYEVFEGQLVPI